MLEDAAAATNATARPVDIAELLAQSMGPGA